MVESGLAIADLAETGTTVTEMVLQEGVIFGTPFRLEGFSDLKLVEVQLFDRDLSILDARLDPSSIYTEYSQAMLVYERGKPIMAIVDNGTQFLAARASRRQQSILELKPGNDKVYAKKRKTSHPIENARYSWEAGFDLGDLIEDRVGNPDIGLVITKKPKGEEGGGITGDSYYVDASGARVV